MNPDPLDIVFLGLSITSSWGNGHATTYRALVKALAARGHRIAFLERDMPWYAANRDLPQPPYGETYLYHSRTDLDRRFSERIRQADLVVLGSFVPEGVAVARWLLENTEGVLAFYDIDTPVTLAKLTNGGCDYLTADLIGQFHLYLSFTGGPLLQRLEAEFGARRARPLYCSVDPELYYPESLPSAYDLGYLGTYSEDRQPGLERCLLQPARQWPAGRFAVVGPLYPAGVNWPANVHRIEHLPPSLHRSFYNEQRATLNLTRDAMKATGYAPSVRLFEAAACATPIISDRWEGLDTFFTPGKEILLSDNAEQTLHHLRELSPKALRAIGQAARQRVLAEHTADQRAAELESHYLECRTSPTALAR